MSLIASEGLRIEDKSFKMTSIFIVKKNIDLKNKM